MAMNFRASIVAAVLLGTGVPMVQAHHSFAAFDRTQQLELKGQVVEFQFTNPHCWIMLEVPQADGAVAKWTIEALSPNVLGRQGWRPSTLKPGDKVTVLVNPMRDGTHGGNLITVTLANGTVMGGGA
jgi:hypothetical protein